MRSGPSSSSKYIATLSTGDYFDIYSGNGTDWVYGKARALYEGNASYDGYYVYNGYFC